MSAQLSLPGVKWPPPPRPPPRLPEKRLPRPIAPILGSPRPSSNSEGCVVGRENLYGAIALLAPIAWPEPFGLVLIEAMACGTPVVAFNRGSVPEIVEDGLTGFIVERKEEAVAATDQLSRLSRGAIRWRFEERFTARRMAHEYLAVYRGLMDKRRPRRNAHHAGEFLAPLGAFADKAALKKSRRSGTKVAFNAEVTRQRSQ